MRNNYGQGGFVADTARRLLEHSNLPNFPRALWKKVLADDYVDLTKVVGGIQSTEGDRRSVHQFGEVDIGVGKEPAPAIISSHGDWVQAWDIYSEAVIFAFPHRRPELRVYRDYIMDTFRSAPGHQKQVITFDCLCRLRYERTRQSALSNTALFSAEKDALVIRIASGSALHAQRGDPPPRSQDTSAKSTGCWSSAELQLAPGVLQLLQPPPNILRTGCDDAAPVWSAWSAVVKWSHPGGP